MEFKLPKEDVGMKIRNSLVSSKVVLGLLAEHYEDKRIPKDFIKMATDDIDMVAELSKELNISHAKFRMV